ncbi:leucine-rich repeat protein SHOC-2-like [Oppia nitens]|uniref:leucine-rich repeat protein SHOC-2-like n=1 Tax=Oppia nitens TaxID=1686743 RepID=UPI0023DA79B8|nr:leucine-rich repeat protein SHOC-2-like [Oppia nitens]
MIIDCEAALVNPKHNDRPRYSRAKVGLANDHSSSAVVIVITSQCKEKFKIVNNCTLHKTTISFNLPKKDLYIRNCDQLLLKAFMSLINKITTHQTIPKLANVSTVEKMKPKPTTLTIKDNAFSASDLSNKCLQKLSIETFRTIPRLVWKLNNLCELILNNCDLVDIPHKLQDLKTNLRILDLSKNHIKCIDGSFVVAMKHLKTLNLSHNQLQYIPLELKSMQSLEKLNVSHNELSSVVHSVGSISSLNDLDISHNQINSLSYSLIKELLRYVRLNNLDTSGNPLRERLFTTSIIINKPFPTLKSLCLANIVSTNCLLNNCHQILPHTLYKELQINAEKCCHCGESVVDKRMKLRSVHQSLEQIVTSLSTTHFPSFPHFPAIQYVCYLCLFNKSLI